EGGQVWQSRISTLILRGPSRNRGCSFIAVFRTRDLSNLKPAVYCYRVSPACNNLGVKPKGPSCSVEDIRALESKTRNTNRLEDCHLSQRCPFCHGYFDSNVSGHPIYVSGVQRTCRQTSSKPVYKFIGARGGAAQHG